MKIEAVIKNMGFVYFEEYKIDKNRRLFLIDSDGYEYDANFYNVLKGCPPHMVSPSNHHSLKNISKWIKSNEKNFELTENNKYKNAHALLEFYCNNCHDYFLLNWNNLWNSHGCGVCDGVQIGKFHSFAQLFQDLEKEWDYSKNKISPYKIPGGTNIKYWWKCAECAFSWKTSVDERARGKTGCPSCRRSKGEKRIGKYLTFFGIKSIDEYRFEDCKNKKPLPFDFYISDYNLCIEYHGEQHYEKNKFFGGKEAFKKRQINDKIKEKYCYNNGINLLVIPYWEFNNIEQILKETLSELQGGK